MILRTSCLFIFIFHIFTTEGQISCFPVGKMYNAVLNDIQIINDNKIVVVGDWGSVLISEDRGANWKSNSITGLPILKAVHFLNEKVGFVGGQYGELYRTDNGGETWQEVSLPVSTSITDIHFVNSSVGYITGHAIYLLGIINTVLRTVDGGQTWTTIHFPEVPEEYSFQKVLFTSSQTGFVLANRFDQSFILRTQNAGQTWEKITYTGTTGFRDIYFTDTQNGFILSNKLYKTSNGGVSWSSVDIPLGYEGKALHFFNSLQGIVVIGNVYLSTNNGGISWQEKWLPDQEYVQAIALSFGGNQEGMLIGSTNVGPSGSGNLLYKIKNKGNDWGLRSKLLANEFNFTSFPDFNNGFVANRNGAIYKTQDQGSTWETIYPGSIGTNNFRGIHFFSPTVGVVLTRDSIFQTNDGGINWTKAAHNMLEPEILLVVNEELWLSYSNYAEGVFISRDRGLSWQSISTPADYDIKGIKVVDNNRWFIKADYRTFSPSQQHASIWRTPNQGATWEKIFSSYNQGDVYLTNSLIGDFQFFDNGLGYVSGYNGNIYKTSDSGVNWAPLNINTADQTYISKVHFFNENHGIAITGIDLTEVYETKDGGLTWRRLLYLEALYSILEINPHNLLLVGKNSIFSLYSLNNLTGIINGNRKPSLQSIETYYVTTDSTTFDTAYWEITNGGEILQRDKISATVKWIEPGANRIKLVLENDCGLSKDIEKEVDVSSTTNVQNIFVNEPLAVFPNPAHDHLWLRSTSDIKIFRIELFDLSGKRFYVKISKTGVNTLESIPLINKKGVIILRVSTAENIFTFKVIAQ